MSLPAGFKVNGQKNATGGGQPVPPRVKQMMLLLENLPTGDVLTSTELATRLSMSVGGPALQHPAIADYREKVDNKLFWGSRKSIAQLRKQLTEPEDSDDQN